MTNSLTSQQKNIKKNGLFDLGSGYPSIQISNELNRLWIDSTIDAGDILSGSSIHRVNEISHNLSNQLVSTLARCLNIPSEKEQLIKLVSSGSIAIDRVLGALKDYARAIGTKSLEMITLDPCFDVPKLLASEKGINVNYIKWDYQNGVPPIKDLVRELRCKKDDTLKFLFICSPDNPTGYVWEKIQLQYLLDAASYSGSFIIVDHCFLHAGVHSDNTVSEIWNCLHSNENWVGIWDTGKTIGMGGNKIACVICSNSVFSEYYSRALEVIQYQIPLHLLLFMGNLLQSPLYREEVKRMNVICRKNLSYIAGNSLENYDYVLPKGGSLTLMTEKKSILSNRNVTKVQELVGVISGEAFFLTNPTRNAFRVSLAREPDYFVSAWDRMSGIA